MQRIEMVPNLTAKKATAKDGPPAELAAENVPQAPQAAGEVMPTDQPATITADRSDPAPRNRAGR